MSSAFTVYPAIDLMKGQVVRLTQGKRDLRTLYTDPPEQVAARLRLAGAEWLHVVDLDAAFGQPSAENAEAIGRLLQTEELHTQLGGGLRDLQAIESALGAGAARVVLGTAAFRQPQLLRRALDRFGPARVVVAVDAQDGRLRVEGWTVEEDLGIEAYTRRLAEDGVKTIVYTDTSRDGTGAGLAVHAAAEIQRRTGLGTIVSGGASGLDDIRRARGAGLAGAVVGKALHDGRLSPEEVLAC